MNEQMSSVCISPGEVDENSTHILDFFFSILPWQYVIGREAILMWPMA